MDPAERQELLDKLHASREVLLAAVDGLNEAQWSYQTVAERWSIAQCVEHVVVTENALFKLVAEDFKPLPAPPDDARMESGIRKGAHTRIRKIEAPEHMRPHQRFASLQEGIAAFLEMRARSIDYINTCPDNLRCRMTFHPVLGDVTAYICALLIAAHPIRHSEQIEEIKNDPGYPRSRA